MPSPYRNIHVNLTNPVSITDHTAVALLNILRNAAGQMAAHDVHFRVGQWPGADAEYIPKAIKALRNMGQPICGVKARHHSFYVLAGTPQQYADFAERISSEQYSQCISAVRSLHIVLQGPQPDPLMIAAHNAMQLSAMTLGQKCGLTLQEIVSEFQPI